MLKHTMVRLAVAAAVYGALSVAYVQQIQGQGQQPSQLSLAKLADDLYVIHNEFVPGNSTALVTSEGVVLVDDKFEVDYDNILAQLRKVTNQPVKYVINTHHQGDHSGSNARMQAMNAVVIASEQARENMVEARQPGVPTIAVKDHAHLYLGGKNVELYHFGRAHTNGDIVVYLPAHRTLVAGDMFTYGDATPQLIDYAGGGSAKEWTSTLDSVLMLDFDRVVPGHGTVTTKAEVRRFRESTVAFRSRVHEMLVRNRSRAEVEAMLRKEFNWADLHVARGLDGAMAELR